MLVQPDIHELGDTRLNAREGLAKAEEDTHRMLQAQGKFMPGQAELENRELSEGTRLDWKEFLRRLMKIAPSVLVKDSNVSLYGDIALYVPKNRDEYHAEFDPNQPDWRNDFRYATGFPKASLAEFSAVTTDHRGIAKTEIRGWRSVLMALISSRVVSYRTVVKEFGEPTRARGSRWHRSLSKFK